MIIFESEEGPSCLYTVSKFSKLRISKQWRTLSDLEPIMAGSDLAERIFNTVSDLEIARIESDLDYPLIYTNEII